MFHIIQKLEKALNNIQEASKADLFRQWVESPGPKTYAAYATAVGPDNTMHRSYWQTQMRVHGTRSDAPARVPKPETDQAASPARAKDDTSVVRQILLSVWPNKRFEGGVWDVEALEPLGIVRADVYLMDHAETTSTPEEYEALEAKYKGTIDTIVAKLRQSGFPGSYGRVEFGDDGKLSLSIIARKQVAN